MAVREMNQGFQMAPGIKLDREALLGHYAENRQFLQDIACRSIGSLPAEIRRASAPFEAGDVIPDVLKNDRTEGRVLFEVILELPERSLKPGSQNQFPRANDLRAEL